MCGRYVLKDWSDEVAQYFGVMNSKEVGFSNWNVAPSQVMPIIAEIEGKRLVEPMKWGLVPMWSKDPVVKYATFNARVEDVFTKPTWRGAIRHHRCLIPASGFYEWSSNGTARQPLYIHPTDQDYFAFAGIFDEWHGELLTYSVLTTTPNKEMSAVHNRMPIILNPEDWAAWLDPSTQTQNRVEPLLLPYQDGKLEIYKVSKDVNGVRNNFKNLMYSVEAG